MEHTVGKVGLFVLTAAMALAMAIALSLLYVSLTP